MRGLISEKERANILLDGFVPEGSEGMTLIQRLTGRENLSRDSLLKIARFFAVLLNKKIPRDYKRQKSLILKWLTDVHIQASHFIPEIRITFEEKKKKVAKVVDDEAPHDEGVLHDDEAPHDDETPYDDQPKEQPEQPEEPEQPTFGVYHFSPSDSPYNDIDFLLDDSSCCDEDWL